MEERIGHYRILSRLGAGGMGEVYLAQDEQLDRQVAIKRIRQDATSPRHRERFRREARLAARLNHPAIVHVYDLLTEGDVDYLVLEYVEGTDLRTMARKGPLPVSQVVDFASQIARGLQEAHRQGIVHRDLKTENVLITPSGQAKIADFGIAKHVTDEGESLTRTDAVLGTYRAMSPEQARGGAVDHRSDLFSFGVLLYELLTGESPFDAENGLATVDRIVHHQPEPVKHRNGRVPEELSRLVEHLLQKDPALRPRSAREVVRDLEALPGWSHGETGTATLSDSATPAALLREERPPSGARHADSALEGIRHRSRRILATGLVLALSGIAGGYYALRGPREPLYVAILQPVVENRGAAGELDLLASAVYSALLRSLANLEGISPKDADEVKPVTGSPTEVARAVAADEVVTSRLDCRAESCQVSLRRLGGKDGAVLWSETFEVPTDDFFLAANAVASQVRRAYPDHRARDGGKTLEIGIEDLKSFTRLRQRFDSRQETDFAKVLADLEEIRRRAPRFLDVYVLGAEVARYQFLRSRDPRDLTLAFDRVGEARRLAPDSPQTLFIWFDVALAGRDFPQAEQALLELQRLVPSDVRFLERQARLARDQGDVAKALEIQRGVVRRHPSWKRLSVLARMEQNNGEIDAARTHLELLLQRSPGNLDGMEQLAHLELLNGSPQRAAELYEAVVRRFPGQTELSNLGLSYFLLRRYAAAARTYERVVGGDDRNPFFLLNLADAYALLGRREDAAGLYRRVVALIEADSAATGPQFLTVKAQALAHLGRGPAAVAAVQEALRSASPDDSGVAYEASLVYALLGETSSALASAEQALKLGYKPFWFSLPWFEDLRARPEFQRLVQGSLP